MAELELRVSSLEQQVEYEGLNLSLDFAKEQAIDLSKKVSKVLSLVVLNSN